ncbi:HTH-type transcriptional regulator ImmR [Lentilactobacillus sunkii]|jgi:transcriptional regulator with XRE-family HTH domain|uniref:HTH-type transcriptional regulator ImmR n=1 Tax=Lentilactobacillus sunkii TaxID=481719 RepID=A0A1E7XG90_9LACO|nr:helix-turn-helix transcriptional regulator [Lentilactobacillus sunkii]OFA12136.1 HTH-type transcriptional regulator ImmR [Lentilactobacillus sunkii]
MRFGERLKQARIKNGLTQKQVADQLNLSRQTISSWETENSYPDIDSLIKLSNFYQISLDVLLKEDVGMKEYLKKQEALDWIKPIKQLTVIVDMIFVIGMLFIRHGGIAGGFFLLLALLNLVVMMRIGRFQEQLTGKQQIERWPQNRKYVYSIVIVMTIVALVSWYFHVGHVVDVSPILAGLWIGILIVEIMYFSKNRQRHQS